jgi:hypothetical protein
MPRPFSTVDVHNVIIKSLNEFELMYLRYPTVLSKAQYEFILNSFNVYIKIRFKL